MTEEDEDRDLKELFERSAAEPSPFELTRMAARARELPARLERVPRRLPRVAWAPAFAAVAALGALGALGVTLTEVFSPGGRAPSPSALSPAPTPAKPDEDPSARAASSTASRPAGLEAPDDDAELDALSLTPEADDDLFDLSTSEETELSP